MKDNILYIFYMSVIAIASFFVAHMLWWAAMQSNVDNYTTTPLDDKCVVVQHNYGPNNNHVTRERAVYCKEAK